MLPALPSKASLPHTFHLTYSLHNIPSCIMSLLTHHTTSHNICTVCSSVYSNVPQVKDTLFVNAMQKVPLYNNVPQKGAMLFPTSEYFYASGLTFVNYADGATLSSCQAFGCTCGWVGGAPLQSDGRFYSGVTQRTDRLRFINSPQRIFWDRSDIIIDLDGSLTGTILMTSLLGLILTHFTQMEP